MHCGCVTLSISSSGKLFGSPGTLTLGCTNKRENFRVIALFNDGSSGNSITKIGVYQQTIGLFVRLWRNSRLGSGTFGWLIDLELSFQLLN